ncbi:hypothetical protein HN371_20795 [Candidatus Poribacteria bacterium]|jgi:hypothetical protein|nr:hypothetical protein [Candidatus Poribacteria bacterium]MBT5532893.1 hypothetical protein [Candidatus Poribacteria bacterium]MBT5714052.1 hypothetical protein [Candidatus Poribacteria bacterium]MBT7099330.1 hypothetical protein [Candidatus Poribacteria bacterium]MBT7803912.1 hypothetical protein [Candidatus Poribacteria bacterium]
MRPGRHPREQRASRLRLWAAVSLCAWAVVIAPDAAAEDAFAGEFLTLGVGGRGLAMGSAQAAIASDATAAYWNPAGLGQLSRPDAMFMHATLHGLDSYDYVNYAKPIGDGVWSASWLRVGVDDIPVTTVPDRSVPVSSTNRPTLRSTASFAQNAAVLGWGTRAAGGDRGDLFVGLAGKFLFVTAPQSTNAFGFGADVGALGTWRLGDSGQLRVGANLQDFTRTKLFWNTVPAAGVPSQRDIILPNVKVGLALAHDVGPGDSTVTLTADTDTKYDFEMHYGAEWDLARTLAVRVGMLERKSDADTLRDVTAGAGFRLGFTGGQSFTVDYAFVGGDIGASHRVSLGLRM